MYFSNSDRRLDSDEDEDEEEYAGSLPATCSQGHRSSLALRTVEGGSICFICFSNLISNPQSPTVHVSYALSQLSRAISQPQFLPDLLTLHPHLLISPLVTALSSFNDEPIARQTIDLVSEMCSAGDSSVYGEFLSRISDRLSSGALAWSRGQIYTIHCLGVLLESQNNFPGCRLKDQEALIINLVSGLQLPSEEIRGEILFVLYKLSILEETLNMDDDGADDFFANCPKLLYLALEALMKTQSDDVRLNCVAFLSVLAKRGLFQMALANYCVSSKDPVESSNVMQTRNDARDEPPLNQLFAEAIKAPLLSSDVQVQISTLGLVTWYLSQNDGSSEKDIQVLIEENIADYVFEILRLSGCKDPVVNSCLQVLDLLSRAEQLFMHRLAIGFTTLLPVLRHVAEVPLHPAQPLTLKLIWNCINNCPGIVSTSHVEEIASILKGMFKNHSNGDYGFLPETFSVACAILIALMNSPSSPSALNLANFIQDAPRDAVLTCLGHNKKDESQLLHSLNLLKEAYAYSQEKSNRSSFTELGNSIIDLCKKNLFPWFVSSMYEIEEEIALGVIEVFHSILLQDSTIHPSEFADFLVSSSWFSYSFGCLGLFPTEKMRWRVYLMFSSLVDVLRGDESGEPIKDAAPHLPSDPMDALFLIGQKSSHNLQLLTCQSAVLLILHTSSLYDDRLADDKLVLASLEQFMLLNSSELLHGLTDSWMIELLVNVYGLYRGLAKISYQIPYSPEAEKILFNLVAEKGWDITSTRIHSTSLKWLFQQERLCKSLCSQLLKFCRLNNNLNGTQIILKGNNCQNVDVHTVGELVSSGDNFGAKLFVCLLRDIVEENGEEYDISSVLITITLIIDIFPSASNQLCIHGICGAIQILYHNLMNSSSQQIYAALPRLLCKILHSGHSESLSSDEAWPAITVKLTERIMCNVTLGGWKEELLIIVATLCLILHKSTNQVLVEASKSILLSTHLAWIVNKTMYEACSKGPSLVDHDEGSKTGEILIILLLLHYFSLKSARAILPGFLDWENLLFDNGKENQPIPFICIRCHDLCRLINFGSAMVKMIASYCLVETFKIISDERKTSPEKFNCNSTKLPAVTSVLEGLLYSSDIRVSMNCAICLSMTLEWENARRNYWCRFIVEELATSLAVPCLASKTLMAHHKPAVHVAIALLKMTQVPQWMNSVFDEACISGIIQNVSASGLSWEMVLLFRELQNRRYLKADQIAQLNRLFQECRKLVYANGEIQEAIRKEDDYEEDQETEEVVLADEGDELGKVCKYLLNLISSLYIDINGSQVRNKKALLQEFDLFSQSVTDVAT